LGDSEVPRSYSISQSKSIKQEMEYRSQVSEMNTSRKFDVEGFSKAPNIPDIVNLSRIWSKNRFLHPIGASAHTTSFKKSFGT
jgi:hypothetical protein